MYEIRYVFVEPSHFDESALEHLTEPAFKILQEYLERILYANSYVAKVHEFFKENPKVSKHWSQYPYEKFPVSITSKMGIFVNLALELPVKEADKLRKLLPLFLLDYCLKDLNDEVPLIQIRVLKDKAKEVPVHPFLDDKAFLRETVELADNYVTTLVNESEAFRIYSEMHKVNLFKLNSDLPYTIPATSREYNSILRRVDQQDKQKFALLCRLVIWNYYAEQFGLVRTVIPVKHWSETLEMYDPFRDPEWKPEDSIRDLGTITQEQINQHLTKAEEHFRIVENEMNTLTKYKDVVVKEVTLIHGKPVDEYTEEELISLIRNAREEKNSIADLVNDSKRMAKRSETLTTNITVYTTALDSLKD